MISSHLPRRYWLPALLSPALLVSSALGQEARPAPQLARGTAVEAQQPHRVAERTETPLQRARLQPTEPNMHPLEPALQWARDGSIDIEKIEDYSAKIVKRERLDGELGEKQCMFLKVRHRPFSVYLYFLGPAKLKGREVIYVDGTNGGKMWAHGTGLQRKMFGTVSIAPKGVIGMQGQRYPLTEIGVLNLVRRLADVAEDDIKFGECQVDYFKEVKLNDRSCTCIQVVHPVPRRNFLFHLARIYVDDEYNLPTRYASYDWPKKKGGKPELIEEYTYEKMKFNNGFTDADFDVRNPNYNFPEGGDRRKKK